jgi:hypothetical protein
MKLRIPRRFATAWDAFCDWANMTVSGPFRRIDLIFVWFFFVALGWGYWTGGWIGALTSGVFYIFMALCALWLF